MNTRRLLSVVPLAAMLATAPLSIYAQHGRSTEDQVGFVEKFALAKDREAALSQLIPGSEEFYFYHALHFQNTRQKEKMAGVMEQWAKRFPNSEQRKMIENREALLTYDANPQATLKFLRERLNLQFNHQQEVRDRKPNLPTSLDQARVAREVYLAASLTPNDDLGQLSDAALEDLVRDKTKLRPGQVRSLLSRLKRPDLPNLLDVIAADLATKESRGFGEFEIHRALLPEQLDELAKRIPALYENQAFVSARMKKLSPGADTDVEFDPAEREAWLDRAWAYATKLSPAFNSLKANLLYQRLQHDRKLGVYDAQRFLAYLQMPRRVYYVNPVYLDAPAQRDKAIDLNANYTDAIRIAPPIGTDEELVRDYFLHIFVAAKPAARGAYDIDALLKPWLPYVRDTWLKPILAEAMITAGLGEAEQWASLLTPPAFQALKDRVDVDFASYNAPIHQPTDEVNIDLFVKNAPKLIVKIYEINALSYFLTNQKQLNTDLPLDGLVANREVTHDFSSEPKGRNPLLRSVRTFKFPELKGKRGAWVIEFIGGGKSSRALVRKGQWSLLQRTGPAGEMLTVLDEKNVPVPNAVVWLEGRKYAVDEKTGYIPVPFTQNPGQQPIILADAAGEFATLTNFEHHAESYKLDAVFHLEREQLLAGKQATVAVHAGLLLGDTQVSLELLTEAVLTISSTTLDGITVTNEVKAPKFDPAKAFTHTFTVPERLASLRITLNGKVANLSKGGEKQDVNAGDNWEVNGIDKTDLTSDGHLSKTSEGYVYELLGKNGEPLPDQQVVFQLRHRDFQHEVYAPLKTDDRGRIALGALAELRELKARTPNNRERQWDLRDFERTWPTALHGKVGDVLQVPLPTLVQTADPAKAAEALQKTVSLLETRETTFTADRHAAIKQAGGLLSIEGLAAGDYVLRINEPAGPVTIQVRITAGTVVKNWLVAPHRSLEVREVAPLQIVSVKPAAEGLSVQLANWNKFTRVQVAATRFLPGMGFWHLSRFTRFAPTWSTPDRQPNLFAAGRNIGDEYRYILERRYSTIYPGNELTRPGLLLNPWEVRSTDLQAQLMAAMTKPQATRGNRSGVTNMAVAEPESVWGWKEAQDKEAPDLDFLAEPAPVLLNLTPDEQGVVHVDRKALGDREFVQVYAENLTGAVWRTLAIGDLTAKFEDQRLTRNLDPAKAFTQKKTATVLTTGKALTLADILTSDLEKYDSLAAVHALYLSLSGDGKLAQFGWVLKWPELKPEEKRAKYSEFACHELSFFLSRKDPEFYAKVIVPYLANKKDKTFMDEYLLKADLRHWLEPWSYARLNIAERCLLAQRLPGEAPATTRHLRELWELLPPDNQRLDQLFETALRGRDLGEAVGDFKEAKVKQEAFFNDKNREASNAAHAFGGAAPLAMSAPAPRAAGAAPGVAGEARRDLAKNIDGLERAEKKSSADRQLTTDADDESGKAKDEKRKQTDRPALTKSGLGTLGLDNAATDLMESEQASRLRDLVRPFFRALGPTKEWAENNYYLLPIAEQNAGLITVNQFWRDYAEWNGQAPFVSAHLAEASHNFPEMMLALGVLDLPFTSPKHESKTEAGKYTLTAGGPLVAFHKEILPATQAKGNSELLVSQNFYQQGDRYREEGNERFDKYVTDEFLTGVVYGANVVVTNPTSTPQKLDVLLQIPKGALPVLGSKPTDSKKIQLAPYTTQTFEYWFYFPAPSPEAGQPFPHYPVHVARNEENVGAAKAFTFHVVRQLTQIDKTSWDYISQYGTEEEVFAFLEKNNLERLKLERIAWRVRQDVKFFQRLLIVLATHHIYNDVIYSYAVVHNNAPALTEWLRHRDDFIAKCGPALKSKLLVIDPIERRTYEHLEYSPLVNQRAHRVGPENRIANPVLRGQYQHLLNILAHAPDLEPMDQMSVVYYLFLQDRVEEALARFHAIAADQLPTRLQHDYFRCYAAFYEENLAEARGLAAQYADYPVDKWRKLFVEVAGQLDELADVQPGVPAVKLDQPDRAVQQSELASTEPSFEFKVENKQVALTWKNLSAVTVNYYLMEPEFLFSSSPFVTEDSGRFSVIKPTKTATVELPKGKDTLDFPLPPEFAKANVLVEILGAGQRHAQAYHANSFKLALTENYGRLELREQSAGKPVSKAYVKVYARLHNGTVRFFKDGYTDLRGKFDYASLNSSDQSHPTPMPRAANEHTGADAGGDKGLNYQMLKPEELDQVERLSILVLHDAYGALTREVNPPSK